MEVMIFVDSDQGFKKPTQNKEHRNCNIPYPEITLFGPLVHFCIVIIIQACKPNKCKSDKTNYLLTASIYGAY